MLGVLTGPHVPSRVLAKSCLHQELASGHATAFVSMAGMLTACLLAATAFHSSWAARPDQQTLHLAADVPDTPEAKVQLCDDLQNHFQE